MFNRLRLAYSLLLCGAFAPAVVIVFALYVHGVDVPYWDHWSIVPLFERAAAGRLTASDLFAQQNEYRQFFPNLLFVLLGRATNWNIRYELWTSFLLACFISASVYVLGARTLEIAQPLADEHARAHRRLKRFVPFALANLLIFSPIQYENWVFGIQIIYFASGACMVAGVIVARSRLAPGARFTLAMCLATIATFSSANGIVCWIALLPTLIWSRTWKEVWRLRGWVALWCAAFAANIAIYLHGYESVSGHPSTWAALGRPLDAALYLMLIFGTPLGAMKGIITCAVAISVLTLWALVVMYFVARRDDFELTSRMIGWLMIGAYAQLTALLIMVGRVGFGYMQGASSRYTTFLLYHTLALIYLAWIVFDDLRRRDVRRATLRFVRMRVSGIAWALMVAFVGLHLVTAARGFDALREASFRMRQGKVCLLFINVLPDEACLSTKLSPDLASLQHAANALNSLGYLRPALLRDARLEEQTNGEQGNALGEFEKLERTEDGALIAYGWARAPHRFLNDTRATDAIVLTVAGVAGDMREDDEREDDIAFALVETGTLEESSIDVERHAYPGHLRWQRRVDPNILPAGMLRIRAWAFDAGTGKAVPLDGSHFFENRRD